jgi:hypothetical protein
VASRCPWRFALAASIRASTSPGVRCEMLRQKIHLGVPSPMGAAGRLIWQTHYNIFILYVSGEKSSVTNRRRLLDQSRQKSLNQFGAKPCRPRCS